MILNFRSFMAHTSIQKRKMVLAVKVKKQLIEDWQKLRLVRNLKEQAVVTEQEASMNFNSTMNLIQLASQLFSQSTSTMKPLPKKKKPLTNSGKIST